MMLSVWVVGNKQCLAVTWKEVGCCLGEEGLPRLSHLQYVVLVLLGLAWTLFEEGGLDWFSKERQVCWVQLR